MDSATTFFKLSPKEVVLDEWEVLDDPADFHFADLGPVLIGLAIYLFVRWSAPSFLRFQDPDFLMFYIYVIRPTLTFFLVVVPILVVAWHFFTRPRRQGHLCLTNWRCIYYERGEGFVKNYYRVVSTDLADIVALHSVYEEGFMGVKTLLLVLYTKFEDSIQIRIGDSGGLLSKIPVVGRLFRRQTIGKDAFTVPPLLFNRVRQRANALVETSSSF